MVIELIYILFTVYLMAEKRPNIHPFFTEKKKKPTKSTEDAESSPDLSTSINDANDVNTEEIPDEESSILGLLFAKYVAIKKYFL